MEPKTEYENETISEANIKPIRKAEVLTALSALMSTQPNFAKELRNASKVRSHKDAQAHKKLQQKRKQARKNRKQGRR